MSDLAKLLIDIWRNDDDRISKLTHWLGSQYEDVNTEEFLVGLDEIVSSELNDDTMCLRVLEELFEGFNLKYYPMSEELDENHAKWCTTLLIAKRELVSNNFGVLIPNIDLSNSRNGTLTFIEYKNRIYGITCWHVVDALRDFNEDDSEYSFYLMLPSPKRIEDKFFQPNSFIEDSLDIAIMEIPRDDFEGLGKNALNISDQIEVESIEYGLAVGFPEQLKYLRESNQRGEIWSLPQTAILAEIDYIPESRFNIQSSLPRPHDFESYSGMSGGPVFWSDGNDFGILGISRAVNTYEPYQREAISVSCELATPQLIIEWIEEYNESLR